MPDPAAILAHDPTAEIDHHLPDDRFVPLRPGDLAAAIAGDAPRFGIDAPSLATAFSAICEFIAKRAAAAERRLSECYEPYNPDRDTLLTGSLDAARTPAAYEQMLASLRATLAKANFEPLDPGRIALLTNLSPGQNLRVRLHPELVQHLEIWVRGISHVERRVRTWRHPIRGEAVRIVAYRRFALVTRLCDDPNILIKLFKDIPLTDMEALLPHAEVRMSWWDQMAVLGGAGGAAGTTAMRVVSLLTGVIYWPRLAWMLAFALGTLAFRTVMGYRRARRQRDAQRTQHLYFQNLDNNAGVIHKLVAMTAEEDMKEAMLAYAACHASPTPIADAADLAGRIERYLNERFGVEVNFDMADALTTLSQLGLWTESDRFRVHPPAWAYARLQAALENGGEGIF